MFTSERPETIRKLVWKRHIDVVEIKGENILLYMAIGFEASKVNTNNRPRLDHEISGKHLSVAFLHKLQPYLGKYRPVLAEWYRQGSGYRDILDPPRHKDEDPDCCSLFNFFPYGGFNKTILTPVLIVGANAVRKDLEYNFKGHIAQFNVPGEIVQLYVGHSGKTSRLQYQCGEAAEKLRRMVAALLQEAQTTHSGLSSSMYLISPAQLVRLKLALTSEASFSRWGQIPHPPPPAREGFRGRRGEQQTPTASPKIRKVPEQLQSCLRAHH